MASALYNSLRGGPSDQNKNQKKPKVKQNKQDKAKKKEQDEIFEEENDDMEMTTSQEREDNLQKALDDVGKDMVEGKEIDIQKFMKTMLLALFAQDSKRNIDSIRENLDTVTEKVEVLESSMDDCDEEITILKKQVVALEVETYATKFLIKNLPMKLNGTEVRERNHDTQASVNEMLEVIEMSPEVVDNTFRMQGKKGSSRPQASASTKIPNVFVQFSSIREVSKFLGKLKVLKENEKFKDIQCEKYVPPSLKPDWDKANLAAYNLRKKKKMITKTVIEENSVVLYAKMKANDQFTKLNYAENV